MREITEAIDFEFRCQHLSVRSVTLSPLADRCGMVRDMWLELVTIIFRAKRGGCVVSCAVAAPHALSTLAVMTPGSMPAESKAFSSLARQRTTRDFDYN